MVTNCSNNYGPYQFPEKLIPVVILKCLRGDPIPVYGKGENIRDWLYVEDHCRALLTVVEKGTPGETYNIGGNNERTNLELVQTLCQILDDLLPSSLPIQPPTTGTSHPPSGRVERSEGKASTTQEPTNLRLASSYASLITFVTDRPGHDLRYAIDASKIKRELGWEPQESFDTGFRKTVQWYLDNRDWWQDILSGDYQLDRLGTAPSN